MIFSNSVKLCYVFSKKFYTLFKLLNRRREKNQEPHLHKYYNSKKLQVHPKE